MKISKLFLYLIFLLLFTSCMHNSKENDVSNPVTVNELQYPELEITKLPTVIINTNGVEIVDRENWIRGGISIENSGDYDFNSVDCKIRGRGNTTWTNAPKKPYAIKLEKKQSILGMPAHKRWVLIANYLDNSFIKNSIAFYLSEYFGLEYTVRGDFINLVLNGEYVGLYWLGEAVNIDKNRVNINEDEDFLLEIDSHFDEDWKFKSALKNLPYAIKNDDAMTEEKLEIIKTKINDLESYLLSDYFPYKTASNTMIDESYRDRIDIDSFAKYYLVQEIMCNLDYFLDLENNMYCSVYITLDNDGLLKAGPVWDFDASFLSYVNKNVLNCTKSIYNQALFKIPEFNKKLSSLMKDSDKLLTSCVNRIDELYDKIKIAQELDAEIWNDETLGEDINFHQDRSGLYAAYGYIEFSDYVNFVKTWLESRIELVALAYSNE